MSATHKTHDTMCLTIMSPTRAVTVTFAAKLKKDDVFVVDDILTTHHGACVKLVLEQEDWPIRLRGCLRSERLKPLLKNQGAHVEYCEGVLDPVVAKELKKEG